jgi:hypothetical protein
MRREIWLAVIDRVWRWNTHSITQSLTRETAYCIAGFFKGYLRKRANIGLEEQRTEGQRKKKDTRGREMVLRACHGSKGEGRGRGEKGSKRRRMHMEKGEIEKNDKGKIQ